MSADEVARLCQALYLKDRERPLVPLQMNLRDEGEKKMGFRLLGKLLSNRLTNRDVFINLFPRLWRTVEGFDIEVISGNTFSFTVKNASDRWRVLQGGLWNFNKSLLVLEEPVGKGEIKGMSFSKVAFWVQIHNMPLICMMAEIGRFLGGMIGEVKDIDTGKSEAKVGDGPEDYNQLFGSWLKADSPIKFGKSHQRKEGGQAEEEKTGTSDFARLLGRDFEVGGDQGEIFIGLRQTHQDPSVDWDKLKRDMEVPLSGGMHGNYTGFLEGDIVTKYKEKVHACKNLDHILAREKIPQDDSQQVVELQEDSQKVKEDKTVEGKEVINVHKGVSVGKWKRWVRDGVRNDFGLIEDSKFGKRYASNGEKSVEKKQKIDNKGENMTTVCNGLSAGRSIPTC
ncbi:hypothetical protein Ddye_012358 [Dipteronia dyeriana]|uniref:DUF4283 domain-containing protein n=1 Tax=Dipteronia dyeriana TaxID=168575 RepID=A0AAE0CJ59_9ROSI|nr:hypothetical protein Ddye_012339 [Dipteronia dyeriana]KAK2652502.1 hypothetical protein Ddye_012358 [Dipteronia dyeriana]